MAVLAVLLAAALFVGAASALSDGTDAGRAITPSATMDLGSIAFVGEQIKIDMDTTKLVLNGTATELSPVSGNKYDLTTATAGTYDVYTASGKTNKHVFVALLELTTNEPILSGKTVTFTLNAIDAKGDILSVVPANMEAQIINVTAVNGGTALEGAPYKMGVATTTTTTLSNALSSPETITFRIDNLTDGSYYYNFNNGETVDVNVIPDLESGGTAFEYMTIYTSTSPTLTMKDGNGNVVNVLYGQKVTLGADAAYTYNLLSSALKGHYGMYNTTGGAQIGIWSPELTLVGELVASAGDSIDGKSVTKNTYINFYIESPKVAAEYANISGTVKIVFTTPANGKTTAFGYDMNGNTVDFKSVALQDAKQLAKRAVAAGPNAVAGTYTAQAEYTSPEVFSNFAEKSNTISFTLQSANLILTAAKDSVVRSNPFTVTIQGEAKSLYFIFLDGISSTDNNPYLQPNQVGYQNSVIPTELTGLGIEASLLMQSTESGTSQPTYGTFETDASGKRTIQYNTEEKTEDKTYTVKVYSLSEISDYDSVKVKVEKGAVTISASGDGSYYIGDEIKLTGTNTDSTNLFLFITGPNLATDGIQLKKVQQKDNANSVAMYNIAPVSVKTDNTWEYKWDTTNCGLDTGAYTIYATSRLTNGKGSNDALVAKNTDTSSDAQALKKYATQKDDKDWYAVKLSDSEYATVSVNLKQPFLSAVPSGTIVAKGDKIYIRGTAEGDPSTLQLYIFGPNKFVYDSITVEDDGTYEKKLEIGSEWSSNQYYVVIEHPMYNNKMDVHYHKAGAVSDGTPFATSASGILFIYNANDQSTVQDSFVVTGTNKLQGSNAADALTKMIDSANIDDIYTKLTFTVAEPWIKVTNPGDQAMGSKFTITGTTNLAADDQLLIEVVSSSFNAVDKTQSSATSGVSQSTKVVAGEGAENTWSVEVDSTNWKLDEYTIKVQGIEVGITATTNFNLVEKVVTTAPTTSATTAVPTGATSVPTTTPTKTPGFGAFIALAGLGAVALLVLRRN